MSVTTPPASSAQYYFATEREAPEEFADAVLEVGGGAK